MTDKHQDKDAVDAAADKVADAGRVAADTATRTARDMAQAGREAGERGAQAMRDGAEHMADQSSAALSAGADYSRSMAQGVQTIAAEWIACGRTLAERTVERMAALTKARDPFDLMGAQRDLIAGGLQDVLSMQQRLGAVSLDVMTGAAQRAARAPAALAA